MKRFTVCAALLVLTLLIARVVQGAVSPDDLGDAGPTTERAAFFDHRATARGVVNPSSLAVDDDAPRRADGLVRFRLRDRNYHRVYLAGNVAVGAEPDSTGRALLPMHYDPGIDRWERSVALGEGSHRYVFVVEELDGDRWERVDPSHPRRLREGEGWVSEVRIDRDGSVVLEREHRDHEADDYDLDLFSEVGATYQRVDGLSLFARPRFDTREDYAPAFEGYVGYGFASEEWSVQGSLLQPLTPSGSLRLVLTALDRSDFTDRTGMDDFENSVATLVFREDGRDWFRREGVGVGLEVDLHEWLLARVEMRSDTYSTQQRTVRAGWTGRDDFLPNPEIDEGLLRSVFARVRFGSDLRHLWLEFEHADPELLSTDFEFTQLTAQYRTRLQMGRSHHLDLRARFGTALSGDLPRQKRYLAGGIGTIRGYRYQSVLERGDDEGESYGGERIALASAEYVIGSRSDFALACFVDAGNVWLDRRADVFGAGWKSSAGLGLLIDGEGHGLRLDLVRPLDGSGEVLVQARLRRPF